MAEVEENWWWSDVCKALREIVKPKEMEWV
jgi:hypothetical protein